MSFASMSARPVALGALGLLLSVLGGCDDERQSPVCQPGSELPCSCADGSPGLQMCRPDGQGYEPCSCSGGGGGAGGSGGAAVGGAGGSPPTEGYRTTDELYQELAELAAQHPSIVELVDYGDSFVRWRDGAPAGYDLLAVHITDRAVGGSKPVFVVVAGHHGDEVIATELARRLVHWLVDGYGSDADATWLVDHHDTWIIPTVSPDTLNQSRPNANVVNLNRNHSFQWLDADGHGDHAASEPEVFHLEDLLAKQLTDQRGPDDLDPAPLDASGVFVTMHAAMSTVSWPWAFTDGSAPNGAELGTIGGKLAATLGYAAGQSHEAVYEMRGCATDWIYGTFGVAAFLDEIGPSDRPFFLQIDSAIWPPQLEALSYVARLARAPYQLGQGPDVRNVASSDEGDRVRISAEVDDGDNGGQLIAAAELFVSVPPWDPAAVAVELEAADGQLDSPTETVTATVPWDTLPGGPQQRHLVFVRGQDGAGHYGPPRATFVQPQ